MIPTNFQWISTFPANFGRYQPILTKFQIILTNFVHFKPFFYLISVTFDQF